MLQDTPRFGSMERMPSHPVENNNSELRTHSNPCYERTEGFLPDWTSSRLDEPTRSVLVVSDVTRRQDHSDNDTDGTHGRLLKPVNFENCSENTSALDSMVPLQLDVSVIGAAGSVALQETFPADQVRRLCNIN